MKTQAILPHWFLTFPQQAARIELYQVKKIKLKNLGNIGCQDL